MRTSQLPGRIPPEQPLRDWLWREPGAYDGLFLPHTTEMPARFLDLLGDCSRIHDSAFGLCLIFTGQIHLTPVRLGPALPLRRLAGGLASYAEATPAVGHLELILAGQRMSLDLSTAPEVDPFSFWDMSQLAPMKSRRWPSENPWRATHASQPVQHSELAEVAASNSVYDDVMESIDAAPDRGAAPDLHRIGTGAIRLAVTVLMIGLSVIVLGLTAGIVLTGVRTGPIGAIIALIIAFALLHRWFMPGARSIETDGQARTIPPGRAPAMAREPGVLSRMWGWAIWNTRAGDAFRNKLQRHMNDVQDMIARGEVDRALKNAISIAQKSEENVRRTALLSSLPKPRATLDLDFSGMPQPVSSIFTTAGLDGLAEQYRALARDLEEKGDHKRAAFIHSELLGDAGAAIRVLEAGKLYEDAAKLATVRKRPGHDIARLWFLADRREIALLMARRYGAMELIADQAEGTDPDFAAYVRRHWIQDLVTAGDLSRAARASADRPALAGLHRDILRQSVLSGLLDDPFVLGAATCNLDWPIEAVSKSRAVPSEADTGTVEQILAARLQDLLHTVSDDAARQRNVLMNHLVRVHPGPEPGSDLWLRRAPALMDGLIRAILSYDSDHPHAPRMPAMRDAAKRLGLATLAEDLSQVVRNRPAKTSNEQIIDLPARDPVSPPP